MYNLIRFTDDLVNQLRKDEKEIHSRNELVSYIESRNWMDKLKKSVKNLEVGITKLYQILSHPYAEYK